MYDNLCECTDDVVCRNPRKEKRNDGEPVDLKEAKQMPDKAPGSPTDSSVGASMYDKLSAEEKHRCDELCAKRLKEALKNYYRRAKVEKCYNFAMLYEGWFVEQFTENFKKWYAEEGLRIDRLTEGMLEMKNPESKTISMMDTVLVRPGDIAILVFAARGVADLMTRGALTANAPSACRSAVSAAVDLRINHLIRQLEVSTVSSDGEIQLEVKYGDRKFFAEALCSYHTFAEDKVYARGWDAVSGEEASARSKAITERYIDIYNRLGGSGWNPD